MKRRSAILLVVVTLLAALVLSPERLSAAGSPAQTATPVATQTSDPPRQSRIVSGNTIFFGCATGAAIGAAALAVPPMVAWAAAAGALPAVVAVGVTAGIGCTVGLFANVIFTTVGWVFDRIGQAWSAIF